MSGLPSRRLELPDKKFRLGGVAPSEKRALLPPRQPDLVLALVAASEIGAHRRRRLQLGISRGSPEQVIDGWPRRVRGDE
jgi:hypothetical protein